MIFDVESPSIFLFFREKLCRTLCLMTLSRRTGRNQLRNVKGPRRESKATPILSLNSNKRKARANIGWCKRRLTRMNFFKDMKNSSKPFLRFVPHGSRRPRSRRCFCIKTQRSKQALQLSSVALCTGMSRNFQMHLKGAIIINLNLKIVKIKTIKFY